MRFLKESKIISHHPSFNILQESQSLWGWHFLIVLGIQPPEGLTLITTSWSLGELLRQLDARTAGVGTVPPPGFHIYLTHFLPNFLISHSWEKKANTGNRNMLSDRGKKKLEGNKKKRVSFWEMKSQLSFRTGWKSDKGRVEKDPELRKKNSELKKKRKKERKKSSESGEIINIRILYMHSVLFYTVVFILTAC